MRSGFYSPYFIVPKKSGGLRPILDLRKGSLELGPSQAPVQNTHTETHFWVRPSTRLVCSDRPEGRVLPRVNPSAPQAIPAVCVRRTGISVQSPALRAVPVAPCLHESSGGSPCSTERTRRAHSQLPRRLAHTSLVSGSVMRTQGLRVNWEKSRGGRGRAARCGSKSLQPAAKPWQWSHEINLLYSAAYGWRWSHETYSGYGKYSDPLKFFTLCYIAAIC